MLALACFTGCCAGAFCNIERLIRTGNAALAKVRRVERLMRKLLFAGEMVFRIVIAGLQEPSWHPYSAAERAKGRSELASPALYCSPLCKDGQDSNTTGRNPARTRCRS